MAESAAQMRREAVARLAEIAGYDHRLDVGLTLARSEALQVLVRQALKAAAGDQLLLEEVRMLHPVGRGDAVALDDAIHQHGLPEATPTRTPADAGDPSTTEDLATVLQEILQ